MLNPQTEVLKRGGTTRYVAAGTITEAGCCRRKYRMQKLSSLSGLMLKTYRHPLLSIFLLSSSSSLSSASAERKKDAKANDPTPADKTWTHTHKSSSDHHCGILPPSVH